MLITGATLLLVPTVYFSATVALGLTGLGGLSWQLASSVRSLYRRQRVLGTATLPGGRSVPITPHIASTAGLRRQAGGRWLLELPHKGLLPTAGQQFAGEDALAVARVLLPLVNRAGASQPAVTAAVRRLEYVPDLEYWLTTTAGNPSITWSAARQHEISKQTADLRLAFEMLLHEDLERRSLEGELWRLERGWQSAEEVAAIADALLLPADIEARMDSLCSKSDG